MARLTRLSRNTIKKWLKEPERDELKYARKPGATKLDPYVEELRQALATDAHRPKRDRRTLLVLFCQPKAKDYAGSYSRLTVNVRRWRAHIGTVTARSAYIPLRFEWGRGVPSRRERGRYRDRRRLPSCATGAHEALRQSRVLVGALARMTRSCPFGAILDITLDRVVEIAIIIALAWRYPDARLILLVLTGTIAVAMSLFLSVAAALRNHSVKSFHYAPGLGERAEAFICLSLMIAGASHLRAWTGLIIGVIAFTMWQSCVMPHGPWPPTQSTERRPRQH